MKKPGRKTYGILILLAILIITGFALWLFWPKSNLGIDFSSSAYKDRQKIVLGPANLSEGRIRDYSQYCPAAQEIVILYSDKGLVEAINLLQTTLATSNDSVELMEINRSLLYEGSSPPMLLQDPETIFTTLDNEYADDTRQKAASDYLIALTYLRGNFEGALESGIDISSVSGEEEWGDEIDEKYDALRAEGMRRLNEVYLNYQDTTLAVLARFDYLGFLEMSREEVPLEDYQSTLTFVEENYPNSALLTRSYINIAGKYRSINDIEMATEYYRKSLETPDYRTKYKRGTAHEMVNELITEIQGSE